MALAGCVPPIVFCPFAQWAPVMGWQYLWVNREIYGSRTLEYRIFFFSIWRYAKIIPSLHVHISLSTNADVAYINERKMSDVDAKNKMNVGRRVGRVRARGGGWNLWREWDEMRLLPKAEPGHRRKTKNIRMNAQNWTATSWVWGKHKYNIYDFRLFFHIFFCCSLVDAVIWLLFLVWVDLLFQTMKGIKRSERRKESNLRINILIFSKMMEIFSSAKHW